jgi:hypothetical protein
LIFSVPAALLLSGCGSAGQTRQSPGTRNRPEGYTAVGAGEKYALVIGNGNYKGITPLNNPENDAADMKTALESLGWTVDMVRNGTLDQMENAVLRLKDRLGSSSNAYGFFFYAGHGVQSGGENYLIPVDANIQSENLLRQRAMPVQFMLDELNGAGNALNIVVLDACRDNPFGWSRSGSRGLSVVSRQPADSIIVYATSAGSTAQDGTGRNGLFTGHLLNNLKNPDLSIREIFDRTGADVQQDSDRAQVPAIYSQFFGMAYLGSQPVRPSSVPQPAPTPAPEPVPAAAVMPKPAPPVPVIDVYVAGLEENATGDWVACYWKNGVKIALTGHGTARANAIAVSGSDVYVAGYEKNAGKEVACYWKNGVKTALTSGATDATAESIVVSGSDVYVAGYEQNAAGKGIACYWKNGVKTTLTSGAADAWAHSVVVSGSDVYVAVFENNPAHWQVAYYWKSGIKTALSGGGAIQASARSITVSGSGVYVAGYEQNATGKIIACYWKNGVKTTLTGGRSSYYAIANSIAVSGSSVYVAGYEDNAAGNRIACYWKNGIKTVLTLTSGATDTSAESIAVSGSDVYIAGYDKNAAGKWIACYWKNEVKTALSGGVTHAKANAITLVTR